MGILSAIANFFTGGENNLDRLPSVNENALTPDSFTPNDNNLYTSSQLVREANERGWIVDDELVKQSSEIAKNVTKNAKNVKKFGKNIKAISKGEITTAKEMSKIITLTASNDSQKYGIVTETQSLLNAQTAAIEAAKANYREQLKANNQRMNELLNNVKSSRDRLRGR
ncbi:hypothetical protein [Planktothrix mougeotii]|uniref:Uncharacterized protein n=1 Tax=Planktothrix mougeotii LEGE 06226 TaxID=1828728 RepID=A0ABR9UEN0_9CYAN|nr:hypothetical protein [Planktothrix mougeotii]MBE9144915.1 hypothetical protein [Planktothrix mougeotii LEGE 06226]